VSNLLIGTSHRGTLEWSWQLGVSGIPATLFLIMLFHIPRSPRWLTAQAKLGEALDVLCLTGIPNAKEELDEIVASIHLELDDRRTSVFQEVRLPVFLVITVGMFCQLSASSNPASNPFAQLSGVGKQ
jgi:hypothetical protein